MDPHGFRLARRPRRAPRETIVALIDVVFFLLVFFMLIGRMDANAPFEVVPPVSDLGAPLPQGGLTVSVSESGALALDGAPADLPAILAAVAGAAEGGGPKPFVRINAHARAPLGAVLPLAEALREAGAAEAALVVTPTAAP
ncbi:ExbD/TolR family protein [Rubrimonas cliftonensis]|uniref:Biopolymer transport protein ExbD n=1 Tax=Rubrimonas cliftonensis TaxID=89524 RepID=A0A1H4BGC1_9RHOB|nr:biopolymer transporter ExbD [Rubrimonas cliftonensis]SEA47255.1 biopolymer transport protein ExbD [Rubrimonas cliftonensis]